MTSGKWLIMFVSTVLIIAVLLCGFNIFGSAFFTGLGNGMISATISFLRTFVIQIAAIFLLPVFFGLEGIWLAIVVAEGVTLLFTVAFLIGQRKKYHY